MDRFKKWFTFGNVVASVAVFMAMSGAAVAVTKVAKNSVTSPSIKNGAVTGQDVKDDGLSGADIDEASLALADEKRPTGPAGGDLAGQYPNPLIGPAAVGTGELADNSVVSAKIANGTIAGPDYEDASITGGKVANESLTGSDLATDSVGASETAPNSVGVSEIVNDAVGSVELKGMTTATSAGVTVTAGTPQNASVTCPAGKIVGGGYSWLDDEANSIIVNAPSETDPSHTWEVRGMVNAGSNLLFAWANCLAN
jgi:hypothetical protein